MKLTDKPRWSWLSFLLFFGTTHAQQDSDNPLEMYGGSVLAMAGREAVVLVTDRRLGRGLALLHGHATRPVWNDFDCCTNVIQQSDARMKNSEDEAVHTEPEPSATAKQTSTRGASSSPWLMTATGLPGDVQSLQIDTQTVLQSQHDQIPLALPNSGGGTSRGRRRPHVISPRAAMMLVSHLLYQRRSYLVETLLVGWESSSAEPDSDNEEESSSRPLLCTMDVLGATSTCQDYACIGGAASGLWGSAARYWEPDLATETLVQRAVLAFLAGVDRNILSGYGAVVHVLTPDCRWHTRTVSSRND